jgi:zinc transporter ZupT
MGPIALAFASVTLVGAVSLAGMLTLAMSETRVRRLATFFVSFAAGALLGDTFIHLVPEIFGVLVHSGLTVRQAALLNAASAAVAILGTATAVLAGTVAHQQMIQVLVPLTAGGFVYIAAADLIPELQHDRSLRALAVQTALIACGIAVMALLTLVD